MPPATGRACRGAGISGLEALESTGPQGWTFRRLTVGGVVLGSSALAITAVPISEVEEEKQGLKQNIQRNIQKNFKPQQTCWSLLGCLV